MMTIESTRCCRCFVVLHPPRAGFRFRGFGGHPLVLPKPMGDMVLLVFCSCADHSVDVPCLISQRSSLSTDRGLRCLAFLQAKPMGPRKRRANGRMSAILVSEGRSAGPRVFSDVCWGSSRTGPARLRGRLSHRDFWKACKIPPPLTRHGQLPGCSLHIPCLFPHHDIRPRSSQQPCACLVAETQKPLPTSAWRFDLFRARRGAGPPVFGGGVLQGQKSLSIQHYRFFF